MEGPGTISEAGRYSATAAGTATVVATARGIQGTATVTVADPPTIAVDDFANYRVFQRDIGGTSKSVAVSGTYANMDWSRVEARVLQHGTDTAVINWTTIDSTPGGGTFSGSLAVPQGGWYDVEVRALDAAGLRDRLQPRHEQVGRGHDHPRHRPIEHVGQGPTTIHRGNFRPGGELQQRRNMGAPGRSLR